MNNIYCFLGNISLSFNKVGIVSQNGRTFSLEYGHDQQRIAMEERVGGTHRIKRYVGGCEYVTETEGGNTLTRSLTYLTGPFGVFAVVEKRNGEETIHYILKDNLDSWTAVTDSDGNVEQRLSYDPWGSLRNPGTWSGSFTGKPMFDRGFTGHEHLTAFGLINMKFTLSERSAKLCLSTAERCELGETNGRMYDPVMSSFLSVDRYVQDPSTSQGFNRYAYCMYNPLRYVDPTGFYMTSGNRHHPDDPPHEIIDGQVVFLLPEVTITPYDEPPVTFNESPYSNTTSGGGSHFDWSTLINNSANGSTIGQGGVNGGGNRGRGSNELKNITTTWIQQTINYYNIQYEINIFEIGALIANYAGSDFNKRMFWNYWYGQREYLLSSNEFEDIVSQSIQTKEPFLSEWNGSAAIAVPVSLYGTIYDNSIGTATIYYDLNGNAIGIHEYYDFNLFPIRKSMSAQIKTSLVFTASLINRHNKDFYINYNYNP